MRKARDGGAKSQRNPRAGVETRPYNGAPSRRPLRSALQFVRSVIHSKSCGGSKILRIRALCGGGKPPPYHGNCILCV